MTSIAYRIQVILRKSAQVSHSSLCESKPLLKIMLIKKFHWKCAMFFLKLRKVLTVLRFKHRSKNKNVVNTKNSYSYSKNKNVNEYGPRK